VSPDLFGGTTIPIAIHAKEVRSLRFDSDATLGAALRTATTIVLHGEVIGGGQG